ncbi:BTB/POZ domain-containing protein 2 [Dermacentor silvarum]|uniref:BTB/POZ domain-containing protein 2 n=1 Tax=Dermacentor silvarum TaxID=543639 RepID=UPI001896C65A|nr:BTB/POZ domain-containing protein 2 [Dermacentor silvarum]
MARDLSSRLEYTGARVARVDVEDFLDTGVLADLEFVVKFADHNERRFRVHKTFMAMRNEVFRAMLFGDLAEKYKVAITDIHPNGFEILLRFLYSGIAKIGSVDDALRARLAAKKYLVEQLEKACSVYIRKNLHPARLCSFIDYHMQNRYLDMDDDVVALLNSGIARDALASKEFSTALEETVHCIVDKIRNVPEDRVVNAVFGWVQEKRVRSLQTDKPHELKTLMRPFFPKLRFLSMSVEEFLSGPGSWSIMDDAEVVAVMRNIVKPGWCSLPAGFCETISNRYHQ